MDVNNACSVAWGYRLTIDSAGEVVVGTADAGGVYPRNYVRTHTKIRQKPSAVAPKHKCREENRGKRESG